MAGRLARAEGGREGAPPVVRQQPNRYLVRGPRRSKQLREESPMKVVERYILRRAFVLFIGALAWTLAIVWTTQVLARIDLVTDSGQSALTFFQVASLIIPSIIPIVVPFAIVVAVAQTLSVMNADSELVVINAAGASRLTVIKPIVLLAVAASIFCLVVQNGIDQIGRAHV